MYISFVLGQVIKDSAGKEVGKLLDLIASPSAHLLVISAAVIKSGNKSRNIAWD